MRVTFITFEPTLASARYRQQIPMRELAKLGVDICADGRIVVCGKHGWDEKALEGHERVVFDVCDDHLDGERGPFYRRMIERADLVVCNSAAMQWRIWQATGRSAKVIPDPYEMDERPPSWGRGLLWFGHESNLPDLARELPRLAGHPLQVVSSPIRPGITPWSPEALRQALERCAVVIIPTGKSEFKSPNRLVESVRSGKFVVANPLPAYEEFSEWMWVGDIREGVERAHAQRDDCLARVAKCQDYVRERYSPERIGRMWRDALESL